MRSARFGLAAACLVLLLNCSTGNPILTAPAAEDTAELVTGGPTDRQTDSGTLERLRPDLVAPADFTYLGAFRLPDEGERPYTFAYGGEAMTFHAAGDSAGWDDGFRGSLFVMGHNRMPYGELPNGNQLAEVSIPEPVIADAVEKLPQASFVQRFHEIDTGLFSALDEIPRVGIEYLDSPASGPVLHLCWGQHFQDDDETLGPTHAWVSPELGRTENKRSMEGGWYIGSQSPYSVNNYLFSVPEVWADLYLGGRPLVTGRYRDGGWSGMGPALYAYSPWDTGSGRPADPGTHVEEIVLLQYAKSTDTERIEQCLEGYQHGDEWEGGAWITTSSGRSAVLFAGTKSVGERYWYGFINAEGPAYPCLQEDFIGEFPLCRFADGSPCPDEADWVCSEPVSGRGWWSSRFSAQLILYDPEDLARVVRGELEPWEPQPYAHHEIDEHLFLNPSGIDTDTIGFGEQRRFRIGDAAYDRENDILYVLELFADEAKPLVHVWKIR